MPAVDPLEPPIPLAELYRAHAYFLRTFLLRRGFDVPAAEDLVQDVFMLAQNLGGYRPGPASPRSWLCAITLRLAANAYRKNRKHQRRLRRIAFDIYGSETFSPDVLFYRRHDAKKIDHALRVLPVKQRKCLLSFYLAGETCEKIAENERVPIGTVYSRLHAARTRFMHVYKTTVIPERPLPGAEGAPSKGIFPPPAKPLDPSGIRSA
jgi:RNA polymerase sigma-70 factor (ECF subfamily)